MPVEDNARIPVALAEGHAPALEDLKTEHGLRRLHYVDGLRAFAALWVILYHGWQPGNSWAFVPVAGILLRFFTQGQLPVLIFLVLSGFCLFYPLVLKEPLRPCMKLSYGGFIARRARRILPPFYAALGLCLLAILIFPVMARPGRYEGWEQTLPVTGRTVLVHLVMLHNLSSLDWKKIDYPAWSIGLEWQLYLLFPLFVRLFSFGKPVVPLTLAAAVTLATRVVSRSLHGPVGFALDWGPLNYCLVFVAGMFAAQQTVLGVSRRIPRWSLRLTALLSFGIVFYRGLHGTGLETGAFFFVPLGTVCLLLLAAEPRSLVHRLFSAPWLVTVGIFSYSIYLLHAPLLHFFLSFPFLAALGPAGRFAVVCFVITPIVVALSYLFFLVFERPFIGVPRRPNALKPNALKPNALKQSALDLGVPRIISGQAWIAARIGRLASTSAREMNLSDVNLANVSHVLIVHLFEIGDAVMLTPFLRELRRLSPDAQITLVVKPEVRPLVTNCPYVTEVLAYQVSCKPAWRPLILPCQAFLTMASWRQTRRFDLALVPSWLADNSYASFLACFSGAGCRVGYSETISSRRRRLNRGFDQLYTHTLDHTSVQHDVRQNLAVLEFLGGTVESEKLELWPGVEEEAFARTFLQNWLDSEEKSEAKIVAICPTAGHSPLKQWPLTKFVALARHLQEEADVRILIVGGPGDIELGAAIENALSLGTVRNVVGKTSLRQLAALLKLCRCFVGSDAGPMHIAAASGIPVVAVFGSSCQHRYGPWGMDHRIVSLQLPCSPCGRGHDPERCVRCIFPEPRCLTTLPVEEVLTAVLAVGVVPA